MDKKKKTSQKIRHALHWTLEHTLGHVITLPIMGVLGLFAGWVLDEIAVLGIISYLSDHPARAAISLLLFGLLVTSLYRGIGYLGIYIRNREILASVGVSGFWLHSDSNDKQTNWESCKAKILADHPNELRILGATGWETFGRPGSPLHDVVQSFRGEIRILLIKPKCNAFKVRARALGVKERDYEREIKNSIALCEQLRDRGKSIVVKLYEQTPIWKMIFTDKYMWLQCYKPDQHVDNTPVYTLFANDSETSLYFPLIDVFRKRWDYDNNETVVRPKVH